MKRALKEAAETAKRPRQSRLAAAAEEDELADIPSEATVTEEAVGQDPKYNFHEIMARLDEVEGAVATLDQAQGHHATDLPNQATPAISQAVQTDAINDTAGQDDQDPSPAVQQERVIVSQGITTSMPYLQRCGKLCSSGYRRSSSYGKYTHKGMRVQMETERTNCYVLHFVNVGHHVCSKRVDVRTS